MCVCACVFVFGMPGSVKKIEYNTVNVGIKNEYLYIAYIHACQHIYVYA